MDEKDEVIAYYEDRLNKAEDFGSMVVPEGATFTGTIEGVSFQVSIFENEDTGTYPGYKTNVTMNYSRAQ